MSDHTPAPSHTSHVSRRDVLRWAVGIAAAPAIPVLSACGGFSTWVRLAEEHQRWFDPQTALALRV